MSSLWKRILRLSGLLLVSTALTTTAFARVNPVDAPGLARAVEAKARHSDALFSMPGVVGTAVGLRADGTPVVKVFLERQGKGFPRMLDGVPVDVEVTGRFYARKGECTGPPSQRPDHCFGDGGEDPAPTPTDPTARFDRPVPIGVSTGHPAITAGTIGARVTDGTNVYALSNNHVYADENLASIGDAVIQPGSYDGGTSPLDDIGTLYDFQDINFTGGDNLIDAAIALSSTLNLGNATLSDGYGVPKSCTQPAALRMKVKKSGRTTGFTSGKVYAINATVNVGYGTGVARFVNQIIVTPGTFSAGGDSGSLIVSNQRGSVNRPVGLLFAGSDLYTIASPIDAVLSRFDVTIDGDNADCP